MVKQLDLFNQASFNYVRELKECLASVVAESGLSREEFLDRMNLVADRYGVRLMKGNGRGLTMTTFEKWLNPTDKERRPSVVALTIFCEVSGSIKPLQVMARPVGARVIDDKDAKLLLWAQEYQKAKEARRKMKRLESEI